MGKGALCRWLFFRSNAVKSVTHHFVESASSQDAINIEGTPDPAFPASDIYYKYLCHNEKIEV